MTSALYGVYGASGCGRGVLPLLRQSLAKNGILEDRLVFVDDDPKAPTLNGHRVVDFKTFASIPAAERYVTIAIADSRTRELLWRRCHEKEIEPLTIRADNVVCMDAVSIGPGAILSPFVTLTSNIRIGKAFHANIYSYIEHDCVIGDFVTFAPNASCNGNIHIEDHAYIGSAAVIKQGSPGNPLVIGKGAVVGMGAVVTKSVPPGVTVVGNPARPLNKAS
ncbi:MAG: acetyltransferase [Hyphomicrobium sp.]|nr:acetyltransferase [Hyphomicrobium sp.]PPC81130.1 MAG: acetyltransferase [Hyphomicrobium sp.]